MWGNGSHILLVGMQTDTSFREKLALGIKYECMNFGFSECSYRHIEIHDCVRVCLHVCKKRNCSL